MLEKIGGFAVEKSIEKITTGLQQVFQLRMQWSSSARNKARKTSKAPATLHNREPWQCYPTFSPDYMTLPSMAEIATH